MLRQLVNFDSVSRLLAVLLAVTAALKVHLLLTNPFADIESGSAFSVLWSAVIVECTVAYIVFATYSKRFKWLVMFAAFAALALVSLYNVALGKTNCGCLGVVSVHPGWFLCVDFIAIALLAFIRPRNTAIAIETTSSIVSRSELGTLCGLAVVALLFALTQLPQVRTITNKFLLGKFVEASVVHIGTPNMLETVETEVQIQNQSSQPVTILGVNKSCSCVVPEDVAYSAIPAFGELVVKVAVTPNGTGVFHQRVVFFLDSPHQFSVSADLVGFFKEN